MRHNPARPWPVLLLTAVFTLLAVGVYSPRWSGAETPSVKGGSAPRGIRSGPSGRTLQQGPVLPEVTGACPTIPSERIAARVFSFNPAGLSIQQSEEARPPHLWTRNVMIWMDRGRIIKPRGPLVFYWHGTNADYSEVEQGLGSDVIRAIVEDGGVVVVPSPELNEDLSPVLLYSWHIADGRHETYDLLVADEIVACFASWGRIDPRRIYSVGFSAGGMQTVQLAFTRAYVAGIVSYSGSFFDLPEPVPGTEFAALLTYGLDEGLAAAFDFRLTQESLFSRLHELKKVAVLCDESPRGHEIPEGFGKTAWRFLNHQVYGTPSPWLRGLPDDFPKSCRDR